MCLSKLNLAPTFLRYFNNHFTPAISSAQRLQRSRHAVQAHKLSVCIRRAPVFPLLDQLEDTVPHLILHLRLIDRIRAPVQADDGHVFEQDAVRSHLLDVSGRETDDEEPAVPGGALHRLRDQADGVVYNVDTPALGRELLDLLGPVFLPVVHGVVCAKGPRDVLLVLCSSGCYDGRAECFGYLNGGEADASGCGVD
jgi:hypothetical protein